MNTVHLILVSYYNNRGDIVGYWRAAVTLDETPAQIRLGGLGLDYVRVVVDIAVTK